MHFTALLLHSSGFQEVSRGGRGFKEEWRRGVGGSSGCLGAEGGATDGWPVGLLACLLASGKKQPVEGVAIGWSRREGCHWRLRPFFIPLLFFVFF